jgi:hypothetical protein
MAHAWKAMVAACTTTPSVRTIVSLRFETFGIANGAAGSRTESEAPWVSFARHGLYWNRSSAARRH